MRISSSEKVNETSLPSAEASLQLDRIRESLSERCRTELGRRQARLRPYLENRQAVEDSLAIIEEARALHREPLRLPLGGLEDVSLDLEQSAKAAVLDPQRLVAINCVLFALEHCHRVLEERSQRLPRLASLGNELPLFPKLSALLERSFEANGEISDRASPELKLARDRVRGLQRNLTEKMEALIRDERIAPLLQEPYFSLRNDRYVLPVRAQVQREFDGIVHNASQTGQTLFIEPQVAVQLGNELSMAQAHQWEEERRVLQDLSNRVGSVSTSIAQGLRLLTQLDETEAAAQLASALNAEPPAVLNDPSQGLELFGLRHPILVLNQLEVVPNHLALEPPTQALVISGPNAGGKTATLTAVGLAALMLKMGLPIPADKRSRMPLFDAVWAVVGDAQNLDQGLSSFSAHVTWLKQALEGATSKSLLLVDEIAADTDPREGGAIAVAWIEAALAQNAHLILTSHLEEVKAWAHVDPRAQNARVAFDSQRMQPTYRLFLGHAGTSSALETAQRVGLPAALIDRAKALLGERGGALAQALASLDKELELARVQQLQAEQTLRDVRIEAEQLQAERRRLQEQRDAQEKSFRESLRAELEFARREINGLLESLRGQKQPTALRAAASAVATRIAEQERAHQHLTHPVEPGGLNTPLKPGQSVWHRDLGRMVDVLDIEGDTVTIQAGALRMKTDSALLSSKPRTAVGAEAASRARVHAPVELASRHLDIRGVRAEEALKTLEQFLDLAARSDAEEVLIVHGLGTGALKAAIHGYLQHSPYAASFRAAAAGEGGSGATWVRLG